MSNRFFDIFAIKEYLTQQCGSAEPKTAWNKVGRAWISKSGEALSFELFLLPNQRYVVQFKDKLNTFESEGGVKNG